jgi:hypothetical protein
MPGVSGNGRPESFVDHRNDRVSFAALADLDTMVDVSGKLR